MKTLYIECNMGAAGDMLMAALYELIEDKEGFIGKMNSIGIPGLYVKAEESKKCGIVGTHMAVKVYGHEEAEEHNHEHHHHHHNGLTDIKALIEGLKLEKDIKDKALEVYKIIASAESEVHGQTMEHIHFHEVGSLDAVADVVGNCILMKEIGADKVVVSPINVGSGQVKCAHGILPVPAPATALILKGMTYYGSEVKGELCTPTGAALLKTFADTFEARPVMRVADIGYGMGTKDFDQANCVRAFLSEEELEDSVVELVCNLDDMSGEEMGFAMEILFEEGALDVYAEPIIMKKSRPAYKLACLCNKKDKDKLTKLIFKHTSTIGIREFECRRSVLQRRTVAEETKWGSVAVKVSSGFGVEKRKMEFDDLARIARENNVSIGDIKNK